MINLLPPKRKQEYHAARANTVLRRYILIGCMAVVVAGAIFGAAFYLNSVNRTNFTQRLADTERSLSDLSEVRSEAKQFNDNIAQARTIFNSQIKLSEVIARISEKLPPGAVLSSIALDSQELSKPLSLTAKVNSVETAGVLKVNFDDSGLFSNVTILSVTGSSGDAGAYPYTVSMSTTLNQAAATSPPKTPDAPEGDQP